VAVGSTRLNAVRPGRLSSESVPPIASASSSAIASPRPLPDACLPPPRKKRSKTCARCSGGMPGPSSSTREPPSFPRPVWGARACREACARTRPGQIADDVHDPLLVCGGVASRPRPRQHVVGRRATAPNSSTISRAAGERDGVALEVDVTGVEAGGRVTRCSLERRCTYHMVTGIVPCHLVHVLVVHQLREPAQRRRCAQLVRGVGDELRPRGRAAPSAGAWSKARASADLVLPWSTRAWAFPPACLPAVPPADPPADSPGRAQ
jgi:hypothetical protein